MLCCSLSLEEFLQNIAVQGRFGLARGNVFINFKLTITIIQSYMYRPVMNTLIIVFQYNDILRQGEYIEDVFVENDNEDEAVINELEEIRFFQANLSGDAGRGK